MDPECFCRIRYTIWTGTGVHWTWIHQLIFLSPDRAATASSTCTAHDYSGSHSLFFVLRAVPFDSKTARSCLLVDSFTAGCLE